LQDSSTTWVVASNIGVTSTGTPVGVMCAGGTKNLSGILDRVRLTTIAGTETFDAGSVSIMDE